MMALLPLALAFQVQVRIGIGDDKDKKAKAKDKAPTADEIMDEAERADSARKKAPRRIPLTDALRASAFKDPTARELLLRARVARLTQDSLLVSYDAKSYQRISVGLGFKAIGRERLLFRHEDASHVQWHRDRGAWVEVLGRRTALPVSREGQAEANAGMGDVSPLPYYPGREALWVGNGIAKAEVDERELIHPIAEGAEAYYTYETGDSVIMSLPDGQRITLRELRIAARQPKWNVAVGSFWFDQQSAHLVRAVYRLSVPMDIWAVAKTDDPKAMDDVPIWVKPMLTPMKVDIAAITVEYGLFNQRFWLPRAQGMEGLAQVSFMRVPVTMEQRFKYESVNGLDSVPKLPEVNRTHVAVLRDSLRKAGVPEARRDSLVRVARKERNDTLSALRSRECATSGMYTTSQTRFQGAIRVATRVPCDSAKLAHSAELPSSIYDEKEILFRAADRDELMKALTFGLQPGWAPQKPVLEWGLPYTRYNRAEGLGTGFALKSVLGQGFTATLGGRASTAERQLSGDLTLERSNGRSVLRGTVYRRLDAMNDWGTPLSFGASLASALYARDEGAYYRTWGAELGGAFPKFANFDWRLFADQEWKADVASRWSVFGGANDERFIANPAAQQATQYGASARMRSSLGLDPNGFRLLTDVRAEAAGGDFSYARGLFDATLSHGLGPLAGALTASAGYSGGTLPVQRRFYLGGLQSVRGQTALTVSGDAFWMGRAELGLNAVAARPVVFADVGWAGERKDWSKPGRPLSGAGVGASFLDGLIRFDVARGLYPARQWRADLYLEARF